MNNKILSLFFFILMLSGIFYSIHLFMQLKEKNIQLSLSRLKLEKIEKLYKIELNYRDSVASLSKKNVKDSSILMKIKEFKSAEFLKNSVFKFGLYSIGLEKEMKVVENYLNNKNYKIVELYSLEERPPWYARNQSTIFYYSDSNLELANQIKKDLESLLGSEFELMLGAGQGVRDSEKDVKLNVHLF